MKSLLLFVNLFLINSLHFNIHAAVDPVVYVKGNAASTIYDGVDFYGLEPSNANYVNQYYYLPYITFDDDSSIPITAVKTYEWTIIGGTALTAKNVEKFSAKWNNTKNYNAGVPTKSLRLNVTFTWTPLGKPQQTKTITSIRAGGAIEAQPIEVKHISDPVTITFNGSTLSNSNTLLYACGAAQKTISIPAVYTDPNVAVTYYFFYPNGWNGPATSNTPSVTVNTHVNLGGTIKVEAKRNDSDKFRTKISINITRPTPTKPTINSPDILLCSPKTITASANYATSYSWSTTGGVTANSPGNTNSAQITGVSDGTVKVSATSSVCVMTTAYSTPINVKRSAPLPSSLLVTANGGGAPDFMCNGSGVSLNAYTGEPGTQFGNWTTSDPANTILNYNGGTAYFNSYNNNCYGIDITVSNCFGSVKKGITICVDNCAKVTPVYKVYPNPASNYLHIEFGEAEDISNLPDMIRIFSETGGKDVMTIDPKSDYQKDTFKTDKTIDIQVGDLPRGTYYLHLFQQKGESEKIRVVLQ